LNRNYPSHWGEAGASTAMMALFDSLPRVVAALDLHAFAQLVLRPPGLTFEDTLHEPQFKAMGDAMARIIKNVHGVDYVSEKEIDLYPVSATATDWWYDQSRPLRNLVGKHAADADDMNMPARGTVFRPYSYTIELRPSRSKPPGFMLDEREIIPVGEEILPAFLYYARTALDNVLIE
ncbi:hypothetical protein GGF32_007810, partial [Allomyces javanicus]